MKQQKLIKSMLALGAFIGGAMVAQYLQPLTGPVGGLEGLQQALRMTRADAAPIAKAHILDAATLDRTAKTASGARTPQRSLERVSTENRSHRVSEPLALKSPPVAQEEFENQQPSGRISPHLSLTALPSLSAENSHQSIRWEFPGQFAPFNVDASADTSRQRNTAAITPALAEAQHLNRSEPTPPGLEFVPRRTVDPPPAPGTLVKAPHQSFQGFQPKWKNPAVVLALKTAEPQSAIVRSPKTEVAKTEVAKTEVAKTEVAKTEVAKTEVAKTEVAKTEVVESPAKTEVVRSPPETEVVESRFSPELIALQTKIKQALAMYRNQDLSVREKSAWSIMHSFIGYGVEKKVRLDQAGKRASAIGWICYNNPCRGVRLFYLKNGRIYGRLGPGNQGHEGQFLAMLAQSRVRANYPMKIEGKDFTVADLVQREQETCRPKTELTFKLIGLSHYLDIDATWKDERGTNWSIPRLIQEEMRQPIVGAACGGTHRLFGLAYAVNRCEHKGKSVKGQYHRAKIYLKDYQKYTFKIQNPDGSFSTQYFSGRGASTDEARRLLTTGHISEWLAFSLDPEELTDPKMVKAIDYLATLLTRGAGTRLGSGAVGTCNACLEYLP